MTETTYKRDQVVKMMRKLPQGLMKTLYSSKSKLNHLKHMTRQNLGLGLSQRRSFFTSAERKTHLMK